MPGRRTSNKSSQSKPVTKQYSSIVVAYGTVRGVELSICGGSLNKCRHPSVSMIRSTLPNQDMSICDIFVGSYAGKMTGNEEINLRTNFMCDSRYNII